MPTLSTWSIRLALIYLVVGWGVGAALMINRAWNWSVELWNLVDVHIGLVLFGWTLQLVVGVAYWMLPTFGGRSNRGREWPAWTSVVLINAGVWALVVGAGLAWALVIWTIASVAFALHAWPRAKAFGQA